MKFLFTLFLLTVTAVDNDDTKAGKKLAFDAKVDAKMADACKHADTKITDAIKSACDVEFPLAKAKKCSNVKTVAKCCGDDEKKMFEGFKSDFEICQNKYNGLEGKKLAREAKVDAKVVDACKNDSADIVKACKDVFPKEKAVKCVKGDVKTDTECCGADAKKMFEDNKDHFDDCKKQYKIEDISKKAKELARKAEIDAKIDDACKDENNSEIAKKCKEVFPKEKARACLKKKVKEVKKCCGEDFKAMFSKVEELNQCEEEFKNPTSAVRALGFVAIVFATLAAL